MNARSYCRLTRPVVTALIVIVYSWISWIEIRSLMHLPGSANWFLTLAVVAPWLSGAILTGPLHELMHQSFFGVLPGARRSLRRWHGGVLAGVAGVLVALSFWLAPGMPVASTAGLSVAILALPLLNRRASQSGVRFVWVAGAVLFGCGAIYLAGGRLYEAGLAHPWAVLAAGTLIAAGCFRLGFDRQLVRARAGRPFRSFLTSGRCLFQRDGRALVAVAIAEQQRRDSRVGRDWLETSVDGSDRDWLRVLLHEQYGQQGRAAVWVRFAAFMFGPTAGVLGFSLLLEKLVDPGADLASLCRPVVAFGQAGSALCRSPAVGVLFALYLTPVWSGFMMALISRATFHAAYPLPRHRLAWLSFLLSWRWCGIGVAWQVCSLLALTAFTGWLAGIPPGPESFRLPLALLLVQLPLLPLVQAVTLARRHALGLAGFVLLFILFFVLAVGGAKRLDIFASWPAAAISLTATALGTWIYWRLLLRRYLTNDLNRPMDMIQVLTAA